MTMDLDFLSSLPEEEEEKFVLYETKAREISWEPDNHGDPWFNKEEYVQHMLAFLQENNIDIGLNIEEITATNTHDNYSAAESRLKIFARRMSLRAAEKRRNNVAPYYTLSPSQKTEIHHYIGIIREKIETSSLEEKKKVELLKKLNSFSLDIERDKTRLQSLSDLFVDTMKRTSEGVEELRPVVELLEKTWKIFTKAEINLTLTYEKKLQIQGPKLKIEGPKKSNKVDEFEDEIPF